MERDGIRDGNPASGGCAVSPGTAGFICGGGFKYPAALHRVCLRVCADTGDPGSKNAFGIGFLGHEITGKGGFLNWFPQVAQIFF